MQPEADWTWIWSCELPDVSSQGGDSPLIGSTQADRLSALLANVLSTCADLTGLVLFGMSFDLFSPLNAGENIAVHLRQEQTGPSERPQSHWITFGTYSTFSGTPQLVGVIRGGTTEEAEDYFRLRQHQFS